MDNHDTTENVKGMRQGHSKARTTKEQLELELKWIPHPANFALPGICNRSFTSLPVASAKWA